MSCTPSKEAIEAARRICPVHGEAGCDILAPCTCNKVAAALEAFADGHMIVADAFSATCLAEANALRTRNEKLVEVLGRIAVDSPCHLHDCRWPSDTAHAALAADAKAGDAQEKDVKGRQ